MGIIQFIAKVCVQTAVYWGSPVADGYGGYTYATPVEIPCRWEDTIETIINKQGKETTSNATLMVTQDIHEEGFLYLGKLTDLTTQEKADPLLIHKAFPVQRVDKVPLYRSTTLFVITVYL